MTQPDWQDRFDVHFPCLVKPTSYTFTKNGEKQEVETMTYEKDAVMAFIASELQAERTRLIEEVEKLERFPDHQTTESYIDFDGSLVAHSKAPKDYPMVKLHDVLALLKKDPNE